MYNSAYAAVHLSETVLLRQKKLSQLPKAPLTSPHILLLFFFVAIFWLQFVHTCSFSILIAAVNISMLEMMVIISANYHSFSQWESLEKHPKASDWCCEHRDIIRLWRSLPVTIGGDSAAVLSCLLYFTIFIMLTFSAFPLETAMAVLHHIKSTDLHSGALATFQWYRLATQSCLLLIVDITVQFTYTYVFKAAEHLFWRLHHCKCMHSLAAWMT